MHSPGNHMDFDMALAKEKSQKNPVYYVQYAYVRAHSILRRAKISNFSAKGGSASGGQFPTFNLSALNTPEDIILMRSLVRLPEVLEDTAKDYQVHRLTRYAMDLARAFHNFYEKERIIGEENKNLAKARLLLVSATETVLKNLFGILGISAPKRM
ncbi:MAG: DALR anticodon-binding domain-containing protein, partial [Patescibacteria group bacterium]